MNLQDQVVSLELAKKLDELGVKQDSLFYWNKSMSIVFPEPWVVLSEESGIGKSQICSAFTVAELGELLPARITNPETRNMDFLRFNKGDDYKQDHRADWTVEYHTSFYAPLIRIVADTEANARAKMLVYLIENKLI